MNSWLNLSIILFLTSCAAMQSAVDDTMDGVNKDAEKLGAITETVSDDVEESVNPARDIVLQLTPDVAEKASMEIRNLFKTSNWRNIVEVYAMGLKDYTGQITAILYNEKGTQLETSNVQLTLMKEEPKTFTIEFSEGMHIRRDYRIKIKLTE